MQKDFRTIDEQVEILQKKGLIVEDIDEAKEVLLRENYFFLNGYRHLFMVSEKNRTFIKGSTFRELYSLFLFDRYFRNIIFKNVLVIENQLKSILSYQLSKKYGYKEKDYLNVNNFNKNKDTNRQINDLLRKLKRQIRINGYQHQATSHYINNYGYIPMWVSVKVLSFGLMSELFSILKDVDREEIASYYNISADELEDYLSILSNYRNLCAHEDILYNHETQKEIDDTTYHELLEIPQVEGEYIYGKHDIFALIIILKQMLTHTDFKMMMNEIDYEIEWLSSKLHSIDVQKVLYRMGFPDNYKQISYMD